MEGWWFTEDFTPDVSVRLIPVLAFVVVDYYDHSSIESCSVDEVVAVYVHHYCDFIKLVEIIT